MRVLSKADPPMLFNPSGKITLVIVVLVQKAIYAMEVTDVSKENSPLHPPPLVRFPPVVGVSVGSSVPAYRTVYVPVLQGKIKSVVSIPALAGVLENKLPQTMRASVRTMRMRAYAVSIH